MLIRLRHNFGDWQIVAPLFESSDSSDDTLMDASPDLLVPPVQRRVAPDPILQVQRLRSLQSFDFR